MTTVRALGNAQGGPMNRWILALVAAIALVLPVYGQPAGTTELVYVVNARSDFLSVIGVPENKVVGTVSVGRAASGIAATRSGDRLYVAVESGNKVVAIDTATSKILWETPVGDVPHHVALSGDGKHLYVCIFSANRLDIIDTEKRAVIGSVRVGFQPHNVYTSPDGKRIYSGQMGQDTLAIIDTATRELTKQIPMGEKVRPVAFTSDEKTFFIQLSRLHGFIAYDMASDTRRTVEFPPTTKPFPTSWPYNVVHGIAVTPDDKIVFADSVLENYVAAYSLPDLKHLATIPVDDNPNWMSFSNDGKLLYVTNRGANNVSVISVTVMKELTRIPVGEGPQRMITVRVPSRRVTFTANGQ
jgi:YVTN family beta-propeller protein